MGWRIEAHSLETVVALVVGWSFSWPLQGGWKHMHNCDQAHQHIFCSSPFAAELQALMTRPFLWIHLKSMGEDALFFLLTHLSVTTELGL